jgi:hypothetical protein
MNEETIGWVLLVSGILVAGFAALFGVMSMELTLVLVIFGLADAVAGLVLVLRSRRAA